VILALLRRLTREHHTSLLMATHNVEASELADVVVRMRDGKIEAMGRP
jgi:ABC-type lipoprotein export system ATPase subunit